MILLFNPLLNTTYASNSVKSELVATIRLGESGWENGSPSSLLVNPETSTIYVAHRNSDIIHVIDAVSNNVTKIISVGHRPLDIELNPITNTLYVVNGYPNTISIIDVITNNVTSAIDFTKELTYNGALRGIAVNTQTNKAYVLINDENQAFIAVVDGLSNKINKIVKIADLPFDYDVGRDVRDIAVNSQTNMIYVTMDFDSVLVIDGIDNRVFKTISVEGPTTIAVNEKTNTIYSGNFFSQSISIINGSNYKVIDTLQTIEPQRIEVDEQTDTIYVSGYGGLAIIDGASHQALNWITTGEFSEGVALNPNTKLLYVANAGSDTISVIQTNPEPKWKIAHALGRYSEPQSPDQVFKIKYRVINGTASNFSIQPNGAISKVNTNSKGIFEIIYPRNYPYTNTNAGTPGIVPLFFINGIRQTASETNINDCFFKFSIPFSNESEIELEWRYLPGEQPYHGDSVSEGCLPESIEDVNALTPLQQFKSGIDANKIVCPPNLELVVSPSPKPYCLTHDSAEILKQRWYG
jgi:YVTN family beta-propeller protein